MRFSTAPGSEIRSQSGVGRLGELAARGSDGSLQPTDRQGLQAEATSLMAKINALGNAQYGGQSVLSGGLFSTHVDGRVTISEPDSGNITDPLSGLDLSTQAGASTAMDQVRSAMSALSRERTIAANGSAAMGRRSDLAMQKGAVLEAVGNRQSQDSFLRALQKMGMSET